MDDSNQPNKDQPAKPIEKGKPAKKNAKSEKKNVVPKKSTVKSKTKGEKTLEKTFPKLTAKELGFWRSEAARLQTEVDAGNVAALCPLARLYEDGRGVERNWNRAFELRRRAADADDPNGLTWVGYSYDYGVGAPYDPPRSFEFYRDALKTKTFEARGLALAGVGWAYFNGEGTAVDKKKAFEAFWEARGSDVGFAYMGLADCYLGGVCNEDSEDDERGSEQSIFWSARAAEAWRREAELGSAVAFDYLAGLYTEGRGVERDQKKALEMSLISANAGYAPAAYHVALNYEYVQENPKKAFEYYLKSAEADVPEAFFHLGIAYLTGSGTKINVNEAFRAFQRGAKRGAGYAQFWLGRCYWEGWGRRRNEALAVEWWRRSAENGCMMAQNQLAEYLETVAAEKNGGVVDWKEATRWRLAAAEQGHPEAQLAVGYAFNNGLGVKKDEKKAVFWYRYAAEIGGSPGAKFNLAICLEEGEGVERDPGEAARLMNEAANDGWAPAQNALGVKLYTGAGVDGERDRNRAARLFAEAATQGFAPAFTGLAKCFETGEGVAKNPAAAEFFLRLAAENDAFAAGILGERFAEGDGLPLNSDFAAFWLQKAANGDDPNGSRRLAYCFWEGDGVPRNRVKAVEYWSRAALFGDFDALEELTRAAAAKAVADLFAAASDFAKDDEDGAGR